MLKDIFGWIVPKTKEEKEINLLAVKGIAKIAGGGLAISAGMAFIVASGITAFSKDCQKVDPVEYTESAPQAPKIQP